MNNPDSGGRVAMLRRFLGGLSAFLVSILFAGCPGDVTPPGDISFGEYLVVATIEEDGCQMAEDGSSFTFRARVAVDLDEETAWISLANPPETQLLPARVGRLDEALLVFDAEQSFPENCGCGVIAAETLTLTLLEEEVIEEETGEPNGEQPVEEEEEEKPVPPISGLPHPDEVVEITGSIEYELVAAPLCEAPSEECTLPCTFGYLFSGTRQN